MVASPAVGASVKNGVPKVVAPKALLTMVAVPALALLTNNVAPNISLVIFAFPAVLVSVKTVRLGANPPSPLTMVALAADD